MKSEIYIKNRGIIASLSILPLYRRWIVKFVNILRDYKSKIDINGFTNEEKIVEHANEQKLETIPILRIRRTKKKGGEEQNLNKRTSGGGRERRERESELVVESLRVCRTQSDPIRSRANATCTPSSNLIVNYTWQQAPVKLADKIPFLSTHESSRFRCIVSNNSQIYRHFFSSRADTRIEMEKRKRLMNFVREGATFLSSLSFKADEN